MVQMEKRIGRYKNGYLPLLHGLVRLDYVIVTPGDNHKAILL